MTYNETIRQIADMYERGHPEWICKQYAEGKDLFNEGYWH